MTIYEREGGKERTQDRLSIGGESDTERKAQNYLFSTASKSWTRIAKALKIIPKTYNQKFCTLMFLEGRFLIIACRNHEQITSH